MNVEEAAALGKRLAGGLRARSGEFARMGATERARAAMEAAGVMEQCATILEGSGGGGGARAEAAYNIGVILMGEGKCGEAVGCFEISLGIDPGRAEVLFCCGNALLADHRYQRAIVHYQKAVEVRPDFAAAHAALGEAWKRVGRIDLSLASLRRAVELVPGQASFWSAYLSGLHFSPVHTVEKVIEEHRGFDERFIKPVAARGAVGRIGDADPERKLRIGYVSSDFRKHVAGRVAEHFISRHDRKRFEVYLYSNWGAEDEMTRRFETLADRWRRVGGWSDEQLARQVAEDGVDVLVDLTQHTSENRLTAFAYRAAPVQVAHVGCPGTTGVSMMDWRISDEYHDPVSGGVETVEKVWRLPYTYTCYEPWPGAPWVSELPAKKEGRVTFACLNNASKINVEGN